MIENPIIKRSNENEQENKGFWGRNWSGGEEDWECANLIFHVKVS